MTTVASVVAYTQQLAQTDVNGISSVLGVAFYNDALQDMTRDLIERGIDAAQTQESYTSIASGDAGRFAWPSSMFALKTIEVDYTNSGGQNYLQAQKMDVANLQGSTSWDYLRLNQPAQEPLFTNHGDTGEIFPTPQTVALVRIYHYLTPSEATVVGDNVAYPQTLDYRMLSAKMASMYYKMQENPDMAKVFNEDYERRLGKVKSILAPQSKQPVKPKGLEITGWQF